MTETLAMTTATMLRDHFHTSGMTKEVAELDKAIEAEAPKKDTSKDSTSTPSKSTAAQGDLPAQSTAAQGTFGKAAETHSD